MHAITLTRAQVREVDRIAIEELGIPGLVLMENAGRGAAQLILSESTDGSLVSIVCGGGNNGGDGFVIARHLDLRGHAVRVLLWAEASELVGDAAANFRILQKTAVPIEIFGNRHDAVRLENLLTGASWIVDALLGTGARGEPRPPFDAVIDQLNAAPIPKLAIDLPSGLDCDTGVPASHTICAAETCTFVTAKPGFLAPTAAPYVGRLHVLDIGQPRGLVARIVQERETEPRER
jgi:NAD(P)H-hydrate epimerase